MLCTTTNAAHQFIPSLVKPLSRVYKSGLATVLALSLFTGISSCSQKLIEPVQNTAQNVHQSVQKLKSFQSVLVTKYQEKGISVEINYSSTYKETIRSINVQFTNTSFNKLTDSERQKIARDVATLAQRYFALNKPEDVISVSFVDFRNYVFLQYSQVIGSYTLHPSELASISPQSPPTVESMP